MQNLTDEQKQKFLKIGLVAGAAIILIVIIIAIVFSVRGAIYNAKVEILVTPESSTIKLNNKTYKNGTHDIAPGEYKVEVSKESFNTHEEIIKVEANSTYNLYVILEPIGQSTAEWYAEHPDDDSIYTSIADRQYEKDSAAFTERYPIVNFIPYTEIVYYPSGATNEKYRISMDYDYDNNTLIVLIIFNTCAESSIAIYKQEALGWIRSKGINPDDYTFRYSSLCSDNI